MPRGCSSTPCGAVGAKPTKLSTPRAPATVGHDGTHRGVSKRGRREVAIDNAENHYTPLLRRLPTTKPSAAISSPPHCHAPTKQPRQNFPNVRALRTLDLNSYNHRTRAWAALSLPGSRPDAQAVYDWLAISADRDIDEELFLFRGRSARRAEFVSLLEGNEVLVGVINVWLCVLNARERFKAADSPSRLFVSATAMLYTAVDVSASWDRRLQWFTESMVDELKGSPYSAWDDIDIILFPKLHDGHYYVISVDFRRMRLDVIDNSSAGDLSLAKYGHTRGAVHELFSVFFEDAGVGALFMKVTQLIPRRVRLPWRDSTNKIDCGVFAMRHMESHVGQPYASWDCGLRRGDARALSALRVRFMADILMFQSNAHRKLIIARVSSPVGDAP